LAEFTVEDLRVMLGQEIAVPVLLSRAAQVLLRDPLAEGNYYPGDLLSNVMRLPDAAWSNLRAERKRLAAVLADLLTTSALDVDPKLRNEIVQFLDKF
jgi:hypothetical protein